MRRRPSWLFGVCIRCSVPSCYADWRKKWSLSCQRRWDQDQTSQLCLDVAWLYLQQMNLSESNNFCRVYSHNSMVSYLGYFTVNSNGCCLFLFWGCGNCVGTVIANLQSCNWGYSSVIAETSNFPLLSINWEQCWGQCVIAVQFSENSVHKDQVFSVAGYKLI